MKASCDVSTRFLQNRYYRLKQGVLSNQSIICSNYLLTTMHLGPISCLVTWYKTTQ